MVWVFFRSISIFTILSCPSLAAHDIGVWPYWVSAWLGSMCSRSKSIFTIPLFPFLAAYESGVWPYLVSARLGLTRSRSKSIFTTPSCPNIATDESGVRLDSVSTGSGLTSSRSKRIFTTPLMSFLSRLREWRLATFGVCLVGIDALSLQKHLYYPLMPLLNRP